MTHLLRPAAAAVLALALLAGCGSDPAPVASDPVATDLDADSPAATPTPAPSPSPTVGTYPDFAPDDYAYTLAVTCFCADMGAPVRITVVDGAVTDATYTKDGRGVRRGTQAPDYRRLTIDDVIEAANDTGAARVDVEWPEGQDHPTSVYVDTDERMADEEIGYALSDVVVG